MQETAQRKYFQDTVLLQNKLTHILKLSSFSSDKQTLNAVSEYHNLPNAMRTQPLSGSSRRHCGKISKLTPDNQPGTARRWLLFFCFPQFKTEHVLNVSNVWLMRCD